MKKYLFWLILSGISLAQTTSNFKFNIPATGTQINTWGPLLNANFICLDTLLVSGGVTNCPSGAPLPHLIAGTNITITGTWPNQTVSSTGGGTVTSVFGMIGAIANLSGAINTSGSSVTTVAPAGVISQKPVTSVAIQHAAPLCNGGVCSDSNDGLSWGTAKLTAMAAYDALPATGGTVYFADSTVANTVANTGIYLMASGDPNYGAPPAGWRHVKTGSISFIGVAYGGYGVVPHLGRARLIAGGNASNQPGIWMNGDISTHFENMAIFYPGRGIVLGECSNGLRDGTCPATNVVLDNVSADTTGVNAHTLTGPALDITGASFWIWVNNGSFSGTAAYGDPTSDAASSVLLDGTGNSGVGLVYISNSIVGGGSVKFKQGGNGGGLFVDNVTSEGLHGPATVWFSSFNSAVQSTLKNIVTSDPLSISAASGTATVTNGSPNVTRVSGSNFTTGSTWVNGLVWFGPDGSKIPYGILSVTDSTHLVLATNYAGPTTTAAFTTGDQYSVANTDSSAIGAATISVENAAPTTGPMNPSGQSIFGTATATPLENRQVGTFNGRLVGQGDWAARGFSPVSVRYANLASQVTSGTGVTTGVADPAGGTRAITYAPASLNAVDFYSAAYTPTLNDWVIGQVWVRATTSGGFQGGNVPARIETVSSANTFSPNGASATINCNPAWTGSGEWKKLTCFGKVTATDGAATTLRFRALADATTPAQYAFPVFIKIAAGAISDAEAFEYAQALQAYDHSCIVGTLCGVAGIQQYDSVVTSGLLAQYRMLATEDPCALVDYSGIGNNGIGCAGTSPTIVANTGGILFSANGAVALPAALNTGKTFMMFANVQASTQSANYAAILVGNGNGSSTGGSLGFILTNANAAGAYVPGTFTGSYAASASFVTTSASAFNGTGVLSLVLANPDQIYFGSQQVNNYIAHGNAIGAQAVGHFQLGGGAAGIGTAQNTYISGTIYYMLVYDRALTQAEITANAAAMTSALQTRGVVAGLGVTTSTNNNYVADGDSITSGTGVQAPFSSALTLNGTWNITNRGVASETLHAMQLGAFSNSDIFYQPTSGANAVTIWGGTNDIFFGDTVPLTFTYMANYCRLRRVVGWKCLIATMLSRTSLDTSKNSYNALLRQHWNEFSDGLVDIAADPALGADGASASTTYFLDGVHPTQGSHYNLIAPVMQRAINRQYACQDFSCATTYTTGQAVATAITAATESTNTMTFTTALNPGVGKLVTIAGVTPSGYNGTWTALTSGGASFTAYNYATGLGAGSVFGTAAIPLQKDEDVYVILGGSATSPSFTLESCVGYSGQNIYLKNTNTTSAWVLTPSGSETIDAAATLTMPTASSGNNPVVILQSVLVSAAAGGCNWKRMQ